MLIVRFFISYYNFSFSLHIFLFTFSGHPTIFYQLLQQKGIEFSTLKLYIENRHQVFDEIIKDNFADYGDATKYNSRVSYVKQEIIACLNGGSYEDAIKNNTWWSKFFFETKIHLQNFYDLYLSTSSYYTYLKIHKSDKTRNKLGSAISYFLQSQENQILYYMMDYLKSQGFEISALSFDGLMVNKNKILNVDTLKSIENYVFDKTKFRINIAIKEQNEGLKIKEDYINEIDINEPEIMSAPTDYNDDAEIFRLLSTKQLGQSELVHNFFKDKVNNTFIFLLIFIYLLMFFLFLDIIP